MDTAEMDLTVSTCFPLNPITHIRCGFYTGNTETTRETTKALIKEGLKLISAILKPQAYGQDVCVGLEQHTHTYFKPCGYELYVSGCRGHELELFECWRNIVGESLKMTEHQGDECFMAHNGELKLPPHTLASMDLRDWELFCLEIQRRIWSARHTPLTL